MLISSVKKSLMLRKTSALTHSNTLVLTCDLLLSTYNAMKYYNKKRCLILKDVMNRARDRLLIN